MKTIVFMVLTVAGILIGTLNLAVPANATQPAPDPCVAVCVAYCSNDRVRLGSFGQPLRLSEPRYGPAS